jgi:protein tyrosine phosphatase (PTP) superfamily phosphohydrolase (DUF442 family)
MVRTILFMVIGILVGGSIVYIVIDSQETTVAINAVTMATKDYASEKVTLPLDGKDYKILGQLTGLKNFAVAYEDSLIRGGEVYHDDAADVLNQYGIKLIISVTPNDKERAFCQKYGFELLEMPFDKNDGPKQALIATFLDAVDQASGSVYVHCHGGTHRAGALCMAHRVHTQKWDTERALLEYLKLGGDLQTDQGMIKRVMNYQKTTVTKE